MKRRLRFGSRLDEYRGEIVRKVMGAPAARRFRNGRFERVLPSLDRAEIGFRWRLLSRLRGGR